MYIRILVILIIAIASGCSIRAVELISPCHNYGSDCQQVPLPEYLL